MNSEMKYRWNLDALYKSIEDEEYKQDYAKLESLIGEAEANARELAEGGAEETVAAGITLSEEIRLVSEKLIELPALLSSADTRNTEYPALLNKLMMQLARLEAWEVLLQQALADLPDIDSFITKYDFAKYDFMIREKIRYASYKMDSKLEELAAKLNISGGSAWSTLQGYLTSTLEIEFNGEKLTLSDIRNLAHDPDPEVRKSAYEAELAAYPRIADSLAYSLNSIKQQVNLLTAERGFESPLAEALMHARMDQATLDTMLEVMEESFPEFRRYLKAKARLLGLGEQLSFYDLFAPVGKIDQKYTVEEARTYLVDTFRPLSADITHTIERAFDEAWIDFLPRPGKSGGAFCANLPAIGQSRILTNFDGSFESISTLAHELGHAYHGYCIESHEPLNRDYSMPVAETASTFNETHLTLEAIDRAENPETRLALLEGFLTGTTQTIVDIYSRFLFEKAVFDRSKDEFLDSAALQQIMLDAQDRTYGDALAKDARHPYMWACKGHYYSPHLSYYNFPYAFGSLLSMGLYTRYQEEGAAFMATYSDMLNATTVASCEDVAAKVGIDLRSRDFWEDSMAGFKKMIDLYCELAASQTGREEDGSVVQ